MSEESINLFKRTRNVAFVNCALAAAFFLAGAQIGIAVLVGALLSSLYVVSSGWVLHAFRNAESNMFIQVYFFSMALRFLMVLILFALLMGLTKIDKIYFTVSFLFSYLCQSVSEMIFINKILQKSGS